MIHGNFLTLFLYSVPVRLWTHWKYCLSPRNLRRGKSPKYFKFNDSQCWCYPTANAFYFFFMSELFFPLSVHCQLFHHSNVPRLQPRNWNEMYEATGLRGCLQSISKSQIVLSAYDIIFRHSLTAKMFFFVSARKAFFVHKSSPTTTTRNEKVFLAFVTTSKALLLLFRFLSMEKINSSQYLTTD